MTPDTYPVELTFREWMILSHALGFANAYYLKTSFRSLLGKRVLRTLDRSEYDMVGRANEFRDLKAEIATQIAGDTDDI